MTDEKRPAEGNFGRYGSNRRNVLKKGGMIAAALTVGVPAVSGNVVADDPQTMAVDVPPVISADRRGQVVTAIYPGGDMDPVDIVDPDDTHDHELVGFKLGPDTDDISFEPEDVAHHADAIRWKLLPSGNMGVFFDSSTAESWFTSDDSSAKLSAIGKDGDEEDIMIAWGSDGVIVRATPSPN